ncbi:hypothetical protein ACLOJK_026816 [Asimina triloba]
MWRGQPMPCDPVGMEMKLCYRVFYEFFSRVDSCLCGVLCCPPKFLGLMLGFRSALGAAAGVAAVLIGLFFWFGIGWIVRDSAGRYWRSARSGTMAAEDGVEDRPDVIDWMGRCCCVPPLMTIGGGLSWKSGGRTVDLAGSGRCPNLLGCRSEWPDKLMGHRKRDVDRRWKMHGRLLLMFTHADGDFCPCCPLHGRFDDGQ